MEVIKPLISVHPSEVLVNFMTGHVVRFVEDRREGLRESFRRLFGDDSYEREIEGLQGLEREDSIVDAYARRLAHEGEFPFYSVAMVLQPTRDRTHFHLVYVTRNLKGIDVFKDAERKSLKLAENVRAEAKKGKREQATGQIELFGGTEMPDVNYLAELQDHHEARAREALEQLTAGVTEIVYDDLYAVALRYPLVQEKFLRAWIKAKPNASRSSPSTTNGRSPPRPPDATTPDAGTAVLELFATLADGVVVGEGVLVVPAVEDGHVVAVRAEVLDDVAADEPRAADDECSVHTTRSRAGN